MTATREKLLRYSSKLAHTECWQWMGQVSNSGYGRVMLSNSEGSPYMESAHRASYTSFIGPIPDDKRVVHICGNRLCINPQHLKLE
jgi:hypothetical protein